MLVIDGIYSYFHNYVRLIIYSDDLITIDVLSDVDLSQVERMVCTLYITYQDYPPQRTTLCSGY